MALQKQSLEITFAAGLDTKTDPNWVQPSKFLSLSNTVFRTGQGLTKRNGFGDLTTLPNSAGTTLTTLNDNLIATGSILQAYSANTASWLNQGLIQPVNLFTKALVRNSTSQTSVDSAISSNLVCTVYMDTALPYYQITDNGTGQTIVGRTALPATAHSPRVVVLGAYFVITFIATVAGTPHLQYIAIPVTTPATPGTATDISTQVKSLTTGYDGYVYNNTLFIAWNGSDGGGAVRLSTLSSSLIVGAPKVYATQNGDLISVTIDATNNIIYTTWWDSGTGNGKTAAVTNSLATVLAPTLVIAATAGLSHVTSIAKNGTATILYDIQNNYTYAAIRTDFIRKVSITQSGSVSSTTIVSRALALAGKPFYDDAGDSYVLAAYSSSFQPSYFLIDFNGNVICKVAYSNGGGYISAQVLPSASVISSSVFSPYLFRDNLVSVNKTQGAVDTGGIYTQTGINLAEFRINTSAQYSSEIAKSLHLTGGFLWQYDTVKPVEHSFHIWPEDVQVTTSAVGGNITAQQYYYIFCYEWTDAVGNLHRSAPSLPAGIVTAGATSTNTINVPTLRLTYKDGQNPVRLVGYRWSVAQQTYYQFTSISAPVLNNKTVDSIAVVDTLADSAILGNTLLYTTGAVVENIAAPACAASTMFHSRLFVLDAEDRNLIWYSKQVLDSTPIEMSDLFTIYVAPTIGAQGSTGVITALSAMDDKLIIFKESSIYYLTGNGPDNTGANNDFSEPIYITGTAGCTNPDSIVVMPMGIMFQSDKGIWLLGRDLSTKYIGADVEIYNDDTVVSALAVPGSNEVRFSLASGTVLMYDYYYAQWGTFDNVPAVSSTLYNGVHTYLNSLGQIRHETPGLYLDGSSPVLVKFTTSWLRLTGLQGFQRAYHFYLLSNYLSPYKMNVQVSYDYSNAISQSTVLTPSNVTPLWGSDALWGSGEAWGGTGNIDQRRVFLNQQKCQSMQITITEIFDASKGMPAGAGFAMSGINLLIGVKSNAPKLAASKSAG